MDFLYGLGQGLMISTLVFEIYLTVIDFIKHPNYKIMAFAFVGIELIIFMIGLGICIYVRWEQ